MDPEQIRRIGDAVRKRRRSLGFTSREQAAAVAGFSATTWEKIERGRQASYDEGTYDQANRALRWPPGTLESLLSGNIDASDVPTGPDTDTLDESSTAVILAAVHEVRDAVTDLAEAVKATVPLVSRTQR